MYFLTQVYVLFNMTIMGILNGYNGLKKEIICQALVLYAAHLLRSSKTPFMNDPKSRPNFTEHDLFPMMFVQSLKMSLIDWKTRPVRQKPDTLLCAVMVVNIVDVGNDR